MTHTVKIRRPVPLLCRFIFFVAAAPLLITFPPAAAAEPLQIDARQQFGFAEHYFSQGRYLQAIGEYERFIYFFPEDPGVSQAMYRIGMAWFRAGKYEAARDAFMRLIDHYGDTAPSASDQLLQAYFMLSDSYVKMKVAGQAAVTLHNLITLEKDQAIQDEARYRMGWIFLEAGEWKRAGLSFDSITPVSRDKYQIDRLSAELKGINDIPRKSPALAGALSVIPGAGYLYCGRYYDALTSFLLNGGLMFGAYKAFDDGNTALGAVAALVGIGFYTGNIYGSVSSAHKYNQDSTEHFIRKVRENTKPHLSVCPKGDGFMLSLRYSF